MGNLYNRKQAYTQSTLGELYTSPGGYNCLLHSLIPHLIEQDKLAHDTEFLATLSEYYHFECTITSEDFNRLFKYDFPARHDQEKILGPVLRQFLVNLMRQAYQEFQTIYPQKQLSKAEFLTNVTDFFAFFNWLADDPKLENKQITQAISGYLTLLNNEISIPLKYTFSDYLNHIENGTYFLEFNDIELLISRYDLQIEINRHKDNSIILHYDKDTQHYSFVPSSTYQLANDETSEKLRWTSYYNINTIKRCLHNNEYDLSARTNDTEINPYTQEEILQKIRDAENDWLNTIYQIQTAVTKSLCQIINNNSNNIWPLRIQTMQDIRKSRRYQLGAEILDIFNNDLLTSNQIKLSTIIRKLKGYINKLNSKKDNQAYTILVNHLPRQLSVDTTDNLNINETLHRQPAIDIQQLTHSNNTNQPALVPTRMVRRALWDLSPRIDETSIKSHAPGVTRATLHESIDEATYHLSQNQEKLNFLQKVKSSGRLAKYSIDHLWQDHCHSQALNITCRNKNAKGEFIVRPLRSHTSAWFNANNTAMANCTSHKNNPKNNKLHSETNYPHLKAFTT